MKAIIIDDERLARTELKRLLQDYPEVEVVDEAANAEEGVSKIESQQPDLIFLDIQMPGKTGFDMLSQLEKAPQVIFTTAYDEFALKAFKVNSIDYLLKPIKKEDLKNSLDKYHQMQKQFAKTPALQIDNLLNELKLQSKKTYRNRFLVKQGSRLLSIDVGNIAYFFADGRLCFFKTWDKTKYVIDYTLDELADMLDPEQFYRAGRGFIVHIKSIAQIHQYFNSKLKLELNPVTEKEVIISKEKTTEFKEWMGK